MFDENQIAQYRSIKAPNHLKQRIDRKLTSRHFELRTLSAIAACFILITVASVFAFRGLTPDTILLTYNGQTVTEEQLSVSGSIAKAVDFGHKTITPSGIPLHVEASSDTKISVSDGSIQIFDKNGELLSVGTDMTIDTPADIRWDVSELGSGVYTLAVDQFRYQISIDAENGTMNIYKN